MNERIEKNLGPSSFLEHQKNGDAVHGDKEDCGSSTSQI